MGAFRVLVWVIVGAAVGRLATMLVRRGPLGMVGSMVVGALGAVAAGGLLPALGVSLAAGLPGAALAAALGAVLVLATIRLAAS